MRTNMTLDRIGFCDTDCCEDVKEKLLIHMLSFAEVAVIGNSVFPYCFSSYCPFPLEVKRY